MNERDIFIEAVQQPDDKRSAFLDEACGDDAKLRERVDALLNEELDSFLDQPAHKLSDAQRTSDVPATVGMSIGRYKIKEKIGEGGFGLVFVAEQLEPVRRKVALKLIKPGMDSKEVIARFEAERQALALMDHPNIARVLDAGTTDQGHPYFVMDLVRGIPITTFCDENRLSPEERLKLFLPICRAVQHAHQKGIIHRDIKPSNLLVTMNDGQPVPKVIDFGVAKALNQQLTQHSVYTRFSQMIGTPLYMSPEQAEMSSVDVDTRSDIYSLGVLLYELLTGSTPHDKAQLGQAAFDEVRRIIREEEPPKPSTRLSQSGDRLRGLAAQRKTEPTRLSKIVRGELDWIVMKAIEKERSRRYETANGFAADIERYLNGEAVVACPPTATYRLQKFARQNKTLLATAAVVMAALMLGTLVSVWQANRAMASRERLRQQVYASAMNQASLSLAGDDLYRMRELLNEQDADLRGLEWHLLWNAGHHFQSWARNRDLLLYQDLAVSPDGQILAAVDWIRSTIHVYDRDHLTLVCSPLQIRAPLGELRFSPDGRFLVAAESGGTSIRIFDTKVWEQKMTLESASNCALAFARDQPLMVTSGPGEIMLWDTTTWKQTGSLPVRKDARHVYQLAIHPDGTKIACALATDWRKGMYGPIDFWDLTEGKIVRSFSERLHRDGQDDLMVFSPDGQFLAIGDMEGWVRIFNVAELFSTGDELETEPEFQLPHAIGALAFSPDSKKLAIVVAKDESSASTPDALQVWNFLTDRQPHRVFHDHSRQITDVSFVGDSDTLCSIAYDGTLKLWDLGAPQLYDLVPGVDPISKVGYAPSGEIIFKDVNGFVQSWNVNSKRSVPILATEQTYSRTATSSDGTKLAGVTSDEKRLRVWDLKHEREIYSSNLDLDDLRRRVAAHNGGPSDPLISVLSVSNDGQYVTYTMPLWGYGPLPGLVVVAESRSGRIIGEACVHMPLWFAPAFSPSGDQLVTPEYMSRISMVSDITPESLTPRLRIQGRGVHLTPAFHPDGSIMAIGNHRNEIHLFNVADGKSLQILKGHTQWLMSVVFSQDGNYLVSSALDGTIRIWKRWSDEIYFHLVSTLQRHANDVDIFQVAVAPDGSSLLAVSFERDDNTIQAPRSPSVQGAIQIWKMATPDQVNRSVYDQLDMADYSTDPEQTLQALDDAVTRSPDDVAARTVRARMHFMRGKWEKAVNDCTTALERGANPHNFHFVESRARAYMLGSRWTEALEDWDTLVQLTNESNGKYLQGRGECYLHLGRRREAHADFVSALAQTANLDTIERTVSFLHFAEPVFPTGTPWRYLLGTQAPSRWEASGFDDHKWEFGFAPFGSFQRNLMIRTDSGFQDIWLRKTFTLDREVDAPLVLHLRADEEVDVFINGVLVTPPNCTPNFLHEKRERGDYRRVYPIVPCSDNAPPLHKGENVVAVHCHNRLGSRSFVDVGLYVQNDESDTESKLVAATELAPENAALYTALAIRCVERKNWKQAAVYFHKSAQISPANGLPTWMWAALMYRYSEESDRYHELVTEIIERFENTHWTGNIDYDGGDTVDVAINDLTMFARTCLLMQPTEENLPGIERMVERALESKPLRSAPELTKALLECRRGNPQTAIEWTEKCSPGDRRVGAVLALAYAEMGELEMAREQVAKIVSGRDVSLFHSAIRQNDEAHELAFLHILLDEVERKLRAE